MNTDGTHLILEMENCRSLNLLDNQAEVEKAMLKAAESAGATVLSANFHSFNPAGVSGVVIIAESHLTIHTWPEYAYAAADIFTCGKHLHPFLALESLIKTFQSANPRYQKIKRGLHTQPLTNT